MLRLGWFSTGRDEAARSLLSVVREAIQRGEIGARIMVVFCNREPGEDAHTDQFLELVKFYGIPLVCCSYSRYRREQGLPPVRAGEPLPPWRSDYDRQVIRLLEPYPFDLGVLAGYMLIASGVMCERYDLLNLHPAEPGGPIGTWQEVVWQLIEGRAERSGVMMHLATPEVDRGPPVTYCTYPIRGPAFDDLWREVEGRSVAEIQASEDENNRLFQEIRRQGVAQELPLIVGTLKTLADGEIAIRNKRIVDALGDDIGGRDLTAYCDKMLVGLSPSLDR